jgi:L,D-peptidoglycan transpeptidase YkuD (ErfK/YbiS/YcfS/YnhG family)
MGWCDDPNNKNYNQLIKIPSKYSYERLFRNENIYDLIIVLNYNMKPVIKNKGSAIFIHIAKKRFLLRRIELCYKNFKSFKHTCEDKRN